MYKKLISSILVVALLNLLGCYSIESVTAPEYKQVEEEESKPDEIKVITKDFQEYHFSDSNYYIENDTLHGKAIVKELTFEAKFALEEIESVQFLTPNGSYSSIISVAQYQKIDEESGKPDEIYLTKFDSTKYHFMKDNYYIENDTLYGKGKLLLGDGEEQLNRKIALPDIELIEFEYFNGLTTVLLVLGIGAGAFVAFIAVVILSGSWGPSRGF